MKRTILAVVLFLFASPLLGATHSVVLTWTPSTTAGVGYNIYRSTTSGQYTSTSLTAAPTAVGCTVAAGTCTYTDAAGLVEGTTYFYVVKAVNMTNQTIMSAPSNEVSGTIPIVIPIPAGATQLKIVIN